MNISLFLDLIIDISTDHSYSTEWVYSSGSISTQRNIVLSLDVMHRYFNEDSHLTK